MKTAGDFLSTRVVAVGPEMHLADAAAEIARKNAVYCAVVEKGGRFLGLVRLKDIAGRSADRIFSDLMPAAAPLDINEKMEPSLVAELLRTQGSDEVVVLGPGRRYIGLVTRESLFTWWAASGKRP